MILIATMHTIRLSRSSLQQVSNYYTEVPLYTLISMLNKKKTYQLEAFIQNSKATRRTYS